ncbi:MAG: hypothetical protein BWY56_01088 [Acidobacteria bacterium ADurb.Bin340]|nr:MAG: hypothetical protein BWY56_01088 [Acidobacteria bacterium ADurb.Bin340]
MSVWGARGFLPLEPGYPETTPLARVAERFPQLGDLGRYLWSRGTASARTSSPHHFWPSLEGGQPVAADPLELCMVEAMGAMFRGTKTWRSEQTNYVLLPHERPAGTPMFGLQIWALPRGRNLVHIFARSQDYTALIRLLGPSFWAWAERMRSSLYYGFHFLEEGQITTDLGDLLAEQVLGLPRRTVSTAVWALAPSGTFRSMHLFQDGVLMSHYNRPWSAKAAADWAVMVREDVERHASMHPRGDAARWAQEVAEKAPADGLGEAVAEGPSGGKSDSGRSQGGPKSTPKTEPQAAAPPAESGRSQGGVGAGDSQRKSEKNKDKKRINDANQAERSQGGEEAELGQTPGGPRADLRALEDTDPICSEIRESLLTAYSVGAPGRVEELHRRMAERRRELRESLQGAS